MTTFSFRQSTVAVAVAGALGITASQAQAAVLNFSWSGAITFLNPVGDALSNSLTDYAAGYYANGGPGYGPPTSHGWYGNRTPIQGTIAFDTATGSGVGTVAPFQFFGDNPGSGPTTTTATHLNVTFATVDTAGTLIGSWVYSWNGTGISISIVMDASGLFASIPDMVASGPTSSVSGVGALPASDGVDFGVKDPLFLPLGPSPIATKTLNTGAGCDGLSLATQVNAFTISPNVTNINTCLAGMVDDGIGGDPETGAAIQDFNFNYDILSVHYESTTVPVPASVWMLGSGLLGLGQIARRKRQAR